MLLMMMMIGGPDDDAVYSKLVQSAARAMALGRWDLVSQRATEIQPR